MRKASVTTGSFAVAAIGSLALGGIALADCHHNSHHNNHHSSHCCDSSGGGGGSYEHNARGGDGVGGEATNNCLNVGIPILSGLGIGGSGEAEGASCVANANGTGGNAY